MLNKNIPMPNIIKSTKENKEETKEILSETPKFPKIVRNIKIKGVVRKIESKKPGIEYPDDVEGYDFVVCPYCGKKSRIPLSIHLKKEHNMTLDKFKEEYPLFHTVPKRYNRKMTREEFLEKQKKTENTKCECKNHSEVVPTKIEDVIMEKEEIKNDKVKVIIKEEKPVDTNDEYFIENPFEIIYKKLSRIEKKLIGLEDMFDKIDKIERILTKLYEIWK